MGHVQDWAILLTWFQTYVWYTIWKYRWFALALPPQKIQKLYFKIKGQISRKTTIVRRKLENNQVLSFQSGFRDLKNDRIWCCRFFQTEQTVNRKKSGFRASPRNSIVCMIHWTILNFDNCKWLITNNPFFIAVTTGPLFTITERYCLELIPGVLIGKSDCTGVVSI